MSSQFSYTLPSGSNYVVFGPDNATQRDADVVFYTQVASGSLIGYSAGQTLSNTNLQLAPFEWSRLIRGTAGVSGIEVNQVLSTKIDILNNIMASLLGDAKNGLEQLSQSQNQNTPLYNNTVDILGNIVSGGLALRNGYYGNATTDNGYAFVSSNIDIPVLYSILNNLPHVTDMPDLSLEPVQDAINGADLIKAKGTLLGLDSVGILDPSQVQALQAQISNLVGQDASTISNDKGIGKYGLTCYQLEKVGYIKPWTSRFLDQNPSLFESTMNSPGVWTSKNGINSLDDLLANDNVQNLIQNELMTSGYASINASGIVTQAAQSTVGANGSWIYTSSGLQPTTDMTMVGGDMGLLGQILLSANADYSTLSSGVLNADSPTDINLTRYDYSSGRNTILNKNSQNLGAVTSNASVFGPEATSMWAIAGGTSALTSLLTIGAVGSGKSVVNQLAGLPLYLSPLNLGYAAAGIPTMVNNFTNFGSVGLYGLPLTQQASKIVGQMNTYGRAAQYGMSFVNNVMNGASPTTLISGLTGLAGMNALAFSNFGVNSNLINLQGLTGSLNALANADSLGSIAGGLTALSSSVGGFNGMQGLTNNLGNFTMLANTFGGLGSLLGGAVFGGLFGGGDPLITGTKQAPGYTNTVDRSTVNYAVTSILGNPKITPPVFEYPSASSAANNADVSYAKNMLQSLGVTGITGSSGVPIYTQDQINKQLPAG
jgi:hypothetical protein